EIAKERKNAENHQIMLCFAMYHADYDNEFENELNEMVAESEREEYYTSFPETEVNNITTEKRKPEINHIKSYVNPITRAEQKQITEKEKEIEQKQKASPAKMLYPWTECTETELREMLKETDIPEYQAGNAISLTDIAGAQRKDENFQKI